MCMHLTAPRECVHASSQVNQLQSERQNLSKDLTQSRKLARQRTMELEQTY